MTAPGIEVLHEGRAVEGVEVHPVTGTAGSFTVRVPIPAWALNDGVQSFLVQSGGAALARFSLVAGQPPLLSPRSRYWNASAGTGAPPGMVPGMMA